MVTIPKVIGLKETLLKPVKYNNEYKSIEPCPADKTNLSLLSQLGLFGLNFKKYLNKIVTTSAIPIGIPGCPELAFWTASIERKRIAFAKFLFCLFKKLSCIDLGDSI